MKYKMSQKEKSMLVVVGLVMLCAVFYFFVLTPLSTKAEEARSELELLESQITIAEMKANLLDGLKEKVAYYNNMPSYEDKFFAKSTKQEEYINILDKLVKDCEVYLVKVAFKDSDRLLPVEAGEVDPAAVVDPVNPDEVPPPNPNYIVLTTAVVSIESDAKHPERVLKFIEGIDKSSQLMISNGVKMNLERTTVQSDDREDTEIAYKLTTEITIHFVKLILE